MYNCYNLRFPPPRFDPVSSSPINSDGRHTLVSSLSRGSFVVASNPWISSRLALICFSVFSLTQYHLIPMSSPHPTSQPSSPVLSRSPTPAVSDSPPLLPLFFQSDFVSPDLEAREGTPFTPYRSPSPLETDGAWYRATPPLSSPPSRDGSAGMGPNATSDATRRANPSLETPAPPEVDIPPAPYSLPPRSSLNSNGLTLILSSSSRPVQDRRNASLSGNTSCSASSPHIPLAHSRERRTIRPPKRFIDGEWRSQPPTPTAQPSPGGRSNRRSTQTASNPPPSRAQSHTAPPVDRVGPSSAVRRFPPSKDKHRHKMTHSMWNEICKNEKEMYFVRDASFTSWVHRI